MATVKKQKTATASAPATTRSGGTYVEEPKTGACRCVEPPTREAGATEAAETAQPDAPVQPKKLEG